MKRNLFDSIQDIERNIILDYLNTSHPEHVHHRFSTFGPILFQNFNNSLTIPIAECFRQILLSSIPGWAATKMKISYMSDKGSGLPDVPVLHKYAYIPGIVENIREIVKNLQKGIFRLPDDTKAQSIECERIFSQEPVDVTYKEFLLEDFFEPDQADLLINPKKKIFTFQDRDFDLSFEFTIERGVGYKRSEQIKRDEIADPRIRNDILSLTLDADFNPVKRVSYNIERENLFYDIETNKAISPFEAYSTAYNLFKNQLNL